MNAFRRLSTVPTVPELLRQDAERRAAAGCRSLLAAIWRPALVDSGRAQDGVAQDEVKRRQSGLSPGNNAAARQPPVATRTCLVAPAAPALRRSIRIEACFGCADAVLATARLLNGCGLLSPEGIGVLLAGAERLTRSGMRAWRAGRLPAARQRRRPSLRN